jgi:hypothetical protein
MQRIGVDINRVLRHDEKKEAKKWQLIIGTYQSY